MQSQKAIEQLGYSPKEAKVYLTTLALGEARVSDIVQQTKLPRSSVQIIVDKLHKDGLITFYVMNRYKYWVAENPERLLFDIKRREDNIQNALPALQDIRKKAHSNRSTHKNHEKHAHVLRVVADASLQPILITDTQAHIEYVNPAWEKQFGYTLREIKGENPQIFNSEKTPPEVYDNMWQALEFGQLFQSDQITDTRKDGSTFNLRTTIFPLTYNGETFYIQILNDINHKSKPINTTAKV